MDDVVEIPSIACLSSNNLVFPGLMQNACKKSHYNLA